MHKNRFFLRFQSFRFISRPNKCFLSFGSLSLRTESLNFLDQQNLHSQNYSVSSTNIFSVPASPNFLAEMDHARYKKKNKNKNFATRNVNFNENKVKIRLEGKIIILTSWKFINIVDLFTSLGDQATNWVWTLWLYIVNSYNLRLWQKEGRCHGSSGGSEAQEDPPRCHGYLHASNKRWLKGSLVSPSLSFFLSFSFALFQDSYA